MRRFVVIPLALLALACASSPDDRIAKEQDDFDTFPPAVQEAIRAGEVKVGFTEQQVLLAVGEPDRRTEVVADDQVAHVWTWQRTSPGIGIGLGSGHYGGGVGVGGGISTGRGSRTEDVRRVELVNGVVTRIETLEE
ncbi:MAG: hypothetical protein ACQGVC_03375 [Myxococcota bacterium]